MHVCRGDTASKTEAIYFPPPRTAHGAADTSHFYVNSTGFMDFCEKFKYLGSILHYSLTSDADTDKRIASATAAFKIFSILSASLRNQRVKYTRSLSCLLHSTVVKLGPCGKIYSSAFEVSITSVLAKCVE